MGRKQLTGDNKPRVRRKLGNAGLETVRSFISWVRSTVYTNSSRKRRRRLCVFNRETSVLKFLWRSVALLQQRFSLDHINYDLTGISEHIIS